MCIFLSEDNKLDTKFNRFVFFCYRKQLQTETEKE